MREGWIWRKAWLRIEARLYAEVYAGKPALSVMVADGISLRSATHGPAIVKKASVRLAVLPVFAWTKSGRKAFPALAKPS